MILCNIFTKSSYHLCSSLIIWEKVLSWFYSTSKIIMQLNWSPDLSEVLAIQLAGWKVQKGQKRYLIGSSWTGVKSNWEPTGGAWPLKQSAPPDWGSWVTLITPTGITWAKNGGLISYFVQRRLRLPQLHVLQITDWITDQNTIFELRSYLYWYIEKSNLVWGQHQNGSKRADDHNVPN